MQFRSITLYKDEEIDLNKLLSSLLEFGYGRQAKLTEEGEFVLRGGILDIFPLTFEYPIRLELSDNKIASLASFDIVSGRRIFEHTLVIVLPKRKTSGVNLSHFSAEEPLENFIDLNVGDYVVHNQYGIGKYLGLQRVTSGAKASDHMVIEYAQGDKLYVPCDFMHLVQKYIGFERRPPRIYKLGSKEWQKVKNQAKKGIQKTAFELLRIQAARGAFIGYQFPKDTDWQRQFEATFLYEETPDQASSIEAVKKDMENGRPMDRLICGDVGYGKTEVAMRAAFKAVMGNKQVAFLVPTTILAEQHFQNLSLRLKDFPVNVAMLSRFRTRKEQEQIIKGIKDGSVDIVIGTHRLLSNDIVFKDLGLLVIDEEQRFGVKSKEKLKSLRLAVDVLSLTATPIPRTLYMSLMRIRDMSVINTPPKDRMSVETIVSGYDHRLIRQAIANELNRGGQVYFVHNRVLDIENIYEKVKRLSPQGARIMYAHGQMPSAELERAMLLFLRGQIDILVSTMIIESGIDVPNANTLIVNEAENFGLSDLHQLRGRVGRFSRQAYAFFLIRANDRLSKDARLRLEAISNYSELGAGFKIAFEDLTIRGAGNLLGIEQHGYINAIGFDLYCRLLREVVSEINPVREPHSLTSLENFFLKERAA